MWCCVLAVTTRDRKNPMPHQSDVSTIDSLEGVPGTKLCVTHCSQPEGRPLAISERFLYPQEKQASRCISQKHIRMKKTFITEMEARLRSEREKIVAELTRVSPRVIAGDAFDADYNTLGDKEDESADKAAEIGDNLSLENELSSALRDIDSALKAIANETYGTCKYCKQAIDEARLQIRPTSTSCVACKKTLTQEM